MHEETDAIEYLQYLAGKRAELDAFLNGLQRVHYHHLLKEEEIRIAYVSFRDTMDDLFYENENIARRILADAGYSESYINQIRGRG